MVANNVAWRKYVHQILEVCVPKGDIHTASGHDEAYLDLSVNLISKSCFRWEKIAHIPANMHGKE